MPLVRRKRRKRIKKFKLKTGPREINLRFKGLIDWQIPNINLEKYLRLDNIVETQVMRILLNHGIEGELEKLYLACYRDLLERFRKFSGKTLETELQIAIDRWVERGLDRNIINEIVEELEYKSQGWKLYEDYNEFALMLDYLRLKVFGTITEPITYKLPIDAILILPIYHTERVKLTINYQYVQTVTEPTVYEISEKITTQFITTVSNPNKQYSNFITYQLNISYE